MIAAVQVGRVAKLPAECSKVDESKGLGPRMAIRELRLSERSEGERRAWLEQARIEAVLGSCSLSLSSVRSGLRAYIAFVGGRHLDTSGVVHFVLLADECEPGNTRYFPPKLDILIGWSRLFRQGVP